MGHTMDRVAGWLSVAALASLPWAAGWRPELGPLLAVVGILLAPLWRVRRSVDPIGAGIELLSAATACVVASGWAATGGWLGLAVVVVLVSALAGRYGGARPDAADLVGLLGWSGALVLRPELLASAMGWVAPVVLLVAARRLAGLLTTRGRRDGAVAPGPPDREIEGEVRLDHVVGADSGGLAATRPVTLTVSPGQSVALLVDSARDVEPLVEVLLGRRAPASGRVLVDGAPVDPAERLVALIAPGEPFVPGPLERNLAALCDGPITETQRVSVFEACALDEVETALAGGGVRRDGAPLSALHRLLVLAARVTVSHYRVAVVLDPTPWVNTVRGEVWRRAVVRASVGRTALWFTADRELARRADRVLTWRGGVALEDGEV